MTALIYKTFDIILEIEYGGVNEELLHGSLFVEPLLARTGVVNVLQDVTQHVPLPALVLSYAFHSLVHFSTCRPDDRCQMKCDILLTITKVEASMDLIQMDLSFL